MFVECLRFESVAFTAVSLNNLEKAAFSVIW